MLQKIGITVFSLALCTFAGAGCKREHGPAKAWLELYSGFASPTGGLLLGRVHAGDPPVAPLPGETTMRRLSETREALDSHPVLGAQVAVTVGDRLFQLTSNDRGYIEVAHLPGFSPPAPPSLPLVHVQIEVKDPRYYASPLSGELPVYDDKPGLAVISDIDDTLLDSEVTHKAKMVENALTRSSFELREFPHTAEVLSKLASGRPVFYISGSPWGFCQRIGTYFERTGFPKGPILLKRFSSEPLVDQMSYKWRHIEHVVDAMPSKRWLLFGDSGEKDPEIYARLARERPGRVEKIYIHLVTPEEPSAARFAGMQVFREWPELTMLEPSAKPDTALH